MTQDSVSGFRRGGRRACLSPPLDVSSLDSDAVPQDSPPHSVPRLVPLLPNAQRIHRWRIAVIAFRAHVNV